MKEFTAADYLEDIQKKIPGYRLMLDIVFNSVLSAEKKTLTVKNMLAVGSQPDEVLGLTNAFPNAALTVVDPSETMLTATKTACKNRVNVRYLCAPFENVKTEEPYQLCLCLLVLQFVNDINIFLKKLSAEMTTEGIALISIFSCEHLRYWKEYALSKGANPQQVEKTFSNQAEVMHPLSFAQTEQAIRNAGFSITKLSQILSTGLWLCKK